VELTAPEGAELSLVRSGVSSLVSSNLSSW